MQSFADFLIEHNRVEEPLRRVYHLWASTYRSITKRETIDNQSLSYFLRCLAGKYPKGQVQQAQRALQMYSYYMARCGELKVREMRSGGTAGCGAQRFDPHGFRSGSAGSDQPQGDVKNAKSMQMRRQLFSSWSRLEQELVRLIRLKHLSIRTEKAYFSWMRQFRSFLGSKTCNELSEQDLKSFLSFLAVEKRVAAATQRLAFNAILFLYRNILRIEINGLSTVVPSRVPKRLPVVLTGQEISRVFSRMQGTYLLMARLIYGGGLRLEECLTLRVKDIDFERNCMTIRAGKGNKDRETVLPEKITEEIRRHLSKVNALYNEDQKKGRGRSCHSRRTGQEVLECKSRVELVLGIPVRESVHGSDVADCSSLSCVSNDAPEGVSGCGALGRHPEARKHSHAAPLFRLPDYCRVV